ncbi:DEAD/DEAH box helicase [bacterium]|nr:DEAD/DEAH box helicase [bacterium]
MFTEEQALYFKEYILLKNSGNNVSRIGSSLFESKIALNPHQISAALNFFQNPMRKGMLFADEVGLGKTIEAGIVISQYWYEHKQRIIIICPASLIKQWNEELYEKFHLDSVIIDGKALNNSTFKWDSKIYITSINNVYLNKERFSFNFDLIVIDEAHKLRNVYKDKGVMAPAIKEIFAGQKKLLLTATPFQNNLQELFGLFSLIDENIFPDLGVFKEKYINNYTSYREELKSIIKLYTVRTLRKDVSKYINYTKRNVFLADYSLTDQEIHLYEEIENLLYDSTISTIYSAGQLHLIIVLLQKLLSSSLYAVKNTLINMNSKLKNSNQIIFDEDADEDFENIFENSLLNLPDNEAKSFSNSITSCVQDIEKVIIDSKFERLIKSINDLYEEFDKDSNRNKKILIFTESKKTQKYLYEKIGQFYSKVLMFNGENEGDNIKDLYNSWAAIYNPEKKINKGIAVRRAIVDAFEKEYEILIATDAAAEGLNLQFCSVIINYDLPWNPQKIEQRIGRCHRYGQKNDVIVINLLNSSSTIDKRIYELLNSKLGIFDETFGASDLILGNNISENLEDSIKSIYKTCRSPQEIEKAFENLQNQFRDEINQALKESENNLDTYFDEEVSKSFDLQFIEATRIVDEMADMFYKLIKYAKPKAVFYDNNYSFIYNNKTYTVLTRNDTNAEFCSITSFFGKEVLEKIDWLNIKPRKIVLDYSTSNKKIGFLDENNCHNCTIIVSKIIYDSYETTESLVLTGSFDNGIEIPSDICHKIIKLNSKEIISENVFISGQILDKHKEDINLKIKEISDNNSRIFQEEINYIDNWADSLIEKIQLSVKNMRDERKELQLACDYTSSLEEKTVYQEQIQKLSKKINRAWIELAGLEDEVEEKRKNLINNLKAEKDKSISTKMLFSLEIEIQ